MCESIRTIQHPVEWERGHHHDTAIWAENLFLHSWISLSFPVCPTRAYAPRSVKSKSIPSVSYELTIALVSLHWLWRIRQIRCVWADSDQDWLWNSRQVGRFDCLQRLLLFLNTLQIRHWFRSLSPKPATQNSQNQSNCVSNICSHDNSNRPFL